MRLRSETARRRFVALVALMLVLVALSACGSSDVDAAYSEVVRSYARGLVSTLEATSLEGIAPYATEREVGRMRLYVVMLLEERNSRVDAQLLDQEIRSTETLTDSTARVVAFERWTLVYTDRETGEAQSREDYEGETVYNLVLVDGTWFVDEVIAE